MRLSEEYKGNVRIVCDGKVGPRGHISHVYDLASGEEIQDVKGVVIHMEAGKINQAEITYYTRDAAGNVIVEIDPATQTITTTAPVVDVVAMTEEDE